jgi:hypothetical protein
MTVFARSTDAQVLLLPLNPFCPSTLLSWVWQFSPSEQRLFFSNASSWDFYHVSAGRRQSRNRLYRLGGLTQSLPDDSRAATVSSHGTHVRLLAFALPPTLAPDSLSAPTFSQLVESLPASSSWSVKELSLPSDLGALLSALRSGSARAVSDGSFKDKFGTSAFTIVASSTCSVLGTFSS